MTPLDNRIIVNPDAAEKQRASGIIIPDTVNEKLLSGTVISIGPGKKKGEVRQPMQVAVGDRVMYGKYAPKTFHHNGQNLLSMCEMDVLFIME
jgi:chaperonin GroES